MLQCLCVLPGADADGDANSQPNVTFSPRWKMTTVVAGGWQESRRGKESLGAETEQYQEPFGGGREAMGRAQVLSPEACSIFIWSWFITCNQRNVYELYRMTRTTEQETRTGLLSTDLSVTASPHTHEPCSPSMETDVRRYLVKFVQFLQLLLIFLISNVFNWEAEGRRSWWFQERKEEI